MRHLDIDNMDSYTYRYKFGFGQLLNLITGFGLLGSSIFLLVRFNVDSTLIAVASVLSLIGMVTILLTIHYLTKSLDSEIRIDHDKGIFEVTKNGKTEIRNLRDIVSLDIQEQKSIGLYGFDFDFAKYTFVDGKYCIVTNMMTDDYYIPGGLQPRIMQTILPIIQGVTNV
jgi:hypothetical protein